MYPYIKFAPFYRNIQLRLMCDKNNAVIASSKSV